MNLNTRAPPGVAYTQLLKPNFKFLHAENDDDENMAPQ